MTARVVVYKGHDGQGNYVWSSVTAQVTDPEPTPEPTPEPIPPEEPVPVTSTRWHKVQFCQQEASGILPSLITDAMALQWARDYDVYTGYKCFTLAQMNLMKATNPTLKFYVYRNFGTQKSASGYPYAYYLRDANGDVFYVPEWGSYQMEPSNRGWSATLAEKIKADMAILPWNGVFADVMGWQQEMANRAIVPGTNTLYNRDSYTSASALNGAAVRALLPASGRVIYGNGLKFGVPYFGFANRLFIPGGIDGGMAEQWTRAASTTTNRTLAVWKQDLAMIVDANNRGKSVMCDCKDWVTSNREENMKFGFGSLMLVDRTGPDGRAMNSFGPAIGYGAPMLKVFPWLSGTDYGSPVSPYTENAAGIYQRVFTKGTVVVNPTDVAWSGQVLGQSMSVGGHRSRWAMH